MTEHQLKTDDAQLTIFLDGPEWAGRPAACIGKFTCKSVAAGTELLHGACAYIRDQGITQVIGPMDGDTWHSYRYVTQSDGRSAFLLEPSDKPDGLAALQQAGFSQISGYFSASVPLEEATINPPKTQTDLTVTQWDGTDPEALFGQVYDLSVAAFAANAFYKPITREAFLAMYMPVVPMMKKELIFFARDPSGELAGFLFGIPNYNEGPQTQTVILKTYASLQKGAGQLLANAFHSTAKELGYQTAIHALIHDDNLSALRSAAEGAEIFRRYGLFGKRLDD